MKNLQLIPKMKNRLLFALIISFGLFTCSNSFATNYYSIASGNWATPATWSLTSGGSPSAVAPSASDNAIIERGFTVTAAASAGITNITIGTANGFGTLSISNTFTVTASGSVTFGNTASSSTGGTISGAGTLTFSGTGGIAVNTVSTYTSTVSSLLNLGASVQPVNISAGEVLAISGKISGAGGLNINPSGTGELALGGGTNSTYTGATTLNAGELAFFGAAVDQLGATSAFNIYGGSIDNLSGGAITFGNAYPMFWYGSFTWIGKNAITFISNVTLEADITVSCGSASAAEKSLYLCDVAASTFQGPGGNLNGFSLTVNENFTSAGAGVLFGKSATKSASVVNLNSLTIGTNAMVTAPFQTVGAPINLNGNFTNNGTFVEQTGTVVMQGTGVQTIGGTTNTIFNNLTINNATGPVSLTGNITIGSTGILNLQSGDLTLGNNNLLMNPNSTITNSATTPYTYIITNGTGTLTETYQSTQTNYLFPLGDGATVNDYTPMTLVLTAGATNGTISVLTGNTKYTNNHSNTNFLDRFWTITQSGLTPYTCTSLTGTYLPGSPADINGTVGSIDNAIWSGSSWATYGAILTSPYNVTVSGPSINPFGTVSGIDNSIPAISSFTQSCNSVTANVTGGQTPYTYLWSPGGATTAAIYPTVTNYTCTVTDANAATATAGVTVTSVTANATLNSNIVCGGTGFGSAQMAATGGTSPYTYLWTPGGKTTASVTNLTAGTYTVSAEDHTGCTNTASITILNQGLNLVISGITNHIDCTDGSATATASNGISPYTYSWSDGETNANAVSLTSGTYTITAKDNTGCTATNTITILSSQMRDSIITASSQVIDYWDFNNQLPVSSAITNIPAQYSLVSGAAILYDPNANGPSPTGGVLESANSGTGVNDLSYNKDINNVLGNDSGSLSSGNLYLKALNPAVNAQMTLVLPTTGYNNIVLNYAIEASSSTSGQEFNTISYSTNGGSTWKSLTSAMQVVGSFSSTSVLNMWSALTWKPVQINFSSDPSVSNNPNFEVRWTFSGGSMISTPSGSGNNRYDNVSISGNLISIDGCSGANAYVGVRYGTTPYGYSWSNGTSTVSTSNPSGPVLSAGTYTVTVTDANSCTSTATTTIGSAPSNVSASISSHTNATCNVGGSATALASGGISPYDYSWSNGTSTVSTSNPTGNVLIAGNYTVTVYDVNGCTGTAAVSITQPAVVSVNITSSTNIECNAHGSAVSVTTGGTTPYTYAWTDGETNATATNLNVGNYTITTTDINGCAGTNKVAISAVGQIRDSIVGATSVIHYWDFNQTPPSLGAGGDSLGTSTYPLTAPYTALISSPGYILYSRPYNIQSSPLLATQKDSILDNGKATSPNYCYINDLNRQPLINTALGNDSGSQAGNLFIRSRNPDENAYMYLYLPTTGYANIALNYAITASSSNGALYNIFSYSTDAGNSWKNLTTAMDTFNIGGIYRPDTLQALNPTTTASEWYPINIDFSSDPSVSNNPNFIVRWQFEGPGSNGTSGNLRYDNISLIGNQEETCNGGNNATLVSGVKYGVSPYTYTWIPNVSSTSTASNLSAGSYSVTVTDAYGCSASSSYVITQPVILSATATTTVNILCNGGTGSAIANPNGGSFPYTYSWSSGETTSSISGKSANTYTVTVQDLCGASVSAAVNISQPATLSFSSSVNFSYTSSVQTWTIPAGVTSLSITAIGGGGGNGTNGTTFGGAGATIIGVVSATAGDVVDIVTGGAGTSNTTDAGAGGGGSFAWDNTSSVLLVAAGGGGGGNGTGYADNGYNASTTTSANPSTYGGSGEMGGISTGAIYGGGGGAGFLGNGNTNGSNTAGSGGNDEANGFTGGAGNVSLDPTIVGGYGGGGGAGKLGGGGGGGYNGGGGGVAAMGLGGEGGGSYVKGTETSTAVTNTGNGSVSIIYNTSFVINQNVSCYNGNNGNVTAPSIFGGTTPYTYSWAPSGGSNATASNLSAATYTLTINDNCGATLTATVAITQPASALLANATVTTNVGCNGGNTGNAQSAPSGGTSPYTYTWSNTATTSSISALTAGTFTLTVQDNQGCNATGSVTISQPNQLTTTTTQLSGAGCNGGDGGNASNNSNRRYRTLYLFMVEWNYKCCFHIEPNRYRIDSRKLYGNGSRREQLHRQCFGIYYSVKLCGNQFMECL